MSESVHISCPACLTKNRVPAERLGHAPKCANCRQKLFTSRPVMLTGSSFRRFVDGNDVPIVIDFWAPWCGPCKAMAPAFEQAAREFEPRGMFAKVDTQAEPALGEEFDIRSIPTIVLFRRGKEIARHSGAMSSNDILRWVRSVIPG